jgi:hypothetical protein
MRVLTTDTPPFEVWEKMPKDEFLLTEVNDWWNYHTTKVSLEDKESGRIDKKQWNACLNTSLNKVATFEYLGIKAEEVPCKARSKYSWSHSGVVVYLNNKKIFMDNGVVVATPWNYDDVKKWCYNFILP